MGLLLKHWSRIAVTLIPVLFALLHASGVLPIGVLQRLDDIIYDARLRATMPRTMDERIVIVDLDEKSLAEVGRWPWGRNRMAELADELFDRQKIAWLVSTSYLRSPMKARASSVCASWHRPN
jgi:adenylate cyclase